MTSYFINSHFFAGGRDRKKHNHKRFWSEAVSNYPRKLELYQSDHCVSLNRNLLFRASYDLIAFLQLSNIMAEEVSFAALQDSAHVSSARFLFLLLKIVVTLFSHQ